MVLGMAVWAQQLKVTELIGPAIRPFNFMVDLKNGKIIVPASLADTPSYTS